MYSMRDKSKHSVNPRIIIHGGAGNINRDNLSPDAYNEYRSALLSILRDSRGRLSQSGATALDTATHAVTLLENNGLFNSGHGAVFTREETHELEASVMVSRGYRKRGVGVMNVRRVKNPILLAKEMLEKGEEQDGGGAQSHCQLEGETCDRLAESWGLEMVAPDYFWTKRRWDEHRRALGKSTDRSTYEKHRDASNYWKCTEPTQCEACRSNGIDSMHDANDPSWSGSEYLSQGTVGCVVLDISGTICVATSTGGITNKLPGRIGDTPTMGAGFWAEEWHATGRPAQGASFTPNSSPMGSFINACMPFFSTYVPLLQNDPERQPEESTHHIRAVGMSGTGNGDSFLRLDAVRTAAAMARFSSTSDVSVGCAPLQPAVTAVAGPYGMLQQSAEDRWHKTGEGEGGLIGIDFSGGKGTIVADFNCGGMFRVWIDDDGQERMMVLREKY